MGEVLDKPVIAHEGEVRVYKQSRISYLFYYLITFGFLFLALFVKWNRIFRIGCFILSPRKPLACNRLREQRRFRLPLSLNSRVPGTSERQEGVERCGGNPKGG